MESRIDARVARIQTRGRHGGTAGISVAAQTSMARHEDGGAAAASELAAAARSEQPCSGEFPVELSPRPGQVVGGRYRVDRIIGRGGMGVVVAATTLETGERYAVKVLRAELGCSSPMLERFRREARVLDSVQHPGIVRIHDCGQSEDGVFIVMELLEGETLQERLQTAGRLAVEELLPIVEALSEALASVHRVGIVHRDLKPSNVFLPAGGDPVAKLIDFGTAKPIEGADITQAGQIVGTIRCMAPEQVSGGRVDERTDVYAVGAIVYRALAGRHPFSRDFTIRAILAGHVPRLLGVAPEVARVVERAMAVARGDRFPDIRSFAHALREAVQTARSATIPRSAPAVVPNESRWNRRVVAIAAAVGLVLGFGGTALVHHVASTGPIVRALDETPVQPPFGVMGLDPEPREGQPDIACLAERARDLTRAPGETQRSRHGEFPLSMSAQSACDRK